MAIKKEKEEAEELNGLHVPVGMVLYKLISCCSGRQCIYIRTWSKNEFLLFIVLYHQPYSLYATEQQNTLKY